MNVEKQMVILSQNASKRPSKNNWEENMLNRLNRTLFAAVIAGGLAGPALAEDSAEPIVIPTHNWSSQVVMAYVIGGIFNSIGDKVEYVPADTQAVYEAIRNGDVTISHEVWQSTFGASFYNAMQKGGVIDAGTHAATTLEELGVPRYVIEKNLCPGLPNWEALKECAAVFATADSDGKGRILEGPQSWHGDLMPDRIKVLMTNMSSSLQVPVTRSGLNLPRPKRKAAASLHSTGRQTSPMPTVSISSNSQLIRMGAGKLTVAMAAVDRPWAG